MKIIKNQLNKRGDIPVTILVLGVLMICILAIVSFVVSNNSVQSSFSSIGTVMNASLVKEKISFYESLGYSKEEIKTILGFSADLQWNIIINGNGVTVVFPWP